MRLWQIAGQNPSDDFRGLYITADEASTLAWRPLFSSWGSSVELPPEEAALFEAEANELIARKAEITAEADTQGILLRLPILQLLFELSAFEYDAFLICLAPGLDLRYERLYAFLQDDVSRKIPSVGLILDLLLSATPERIRYLDCFRDQAPLLSWGLLKEPKDENNQPLPLLRRELIAAPEIVSWLAGAYYPPGDLAGAFQIVPANNQPDPLLDGELDLSLERFAFNGSGPILAFHGRDDRRMLAAALRVAGSAGFPLLKVDLSFLKMLSRLDDRAIRLALRDSALSGALPYFTGWDSLVDETGMVPSVILRELEWFLRPVIVSSEKPWRAPGSDNGGEKPILRWSIDPPTFTHRRQLWEHYLGKPEQIAPSDLELLSSQFLLTSTQIQDAALAARHTAFQHHRPITIEDLFDAARRQSSHQLDDLAVKIRPRYTWADIVLPSDELALLKEIAAAIKNRPLVLEEWGLGKKLVATPGISILFAGPPGTGKTLSAQVIAEELGMDLYKIDLSSVVSKYIGETEKNLERIFSQARNSNTVLFFDEADAIFGKRSEVKDAHDRYANIEVGYLLQRMESYEGVVILATNLRSNLDDAFTRRLQFIVDFPFPDEAQRLNIWKVLFPPDAPSETEIDFPYLARHFELSGGSIRNATVSASFLAASEGANISTRHMLHGVRRELQKMGRLIDERTLSTGKLASDV